MAEIKVIINDPKTGKSYQKSVTDDTLFGKQIKDKLNGDFLGLKGYELEITGGSDTAGFPMRPDIQGAGRKRMLLSKGPGVHIKRKGAKIRKTVVGNTVSENTAQVSMVVKKEGSPKLAEAFAAPKEEAPKEEGAEEKPKEEPKKEEKPKEEPKEEKKEEPKEEKKPEEK